jgi:hypothetical protein
MVWVAINQDSWSVKDESGEYGSILDLSKNNFSVGSSYNSNNDDFEEIIGWKKMKKNDAGCAI